MAFRVAGTVQSSDIGGHASLSWFPGFGLSSVRSYGVHAFVNTDLMAWPCSKERKRLQYVFLHKWLVFLNS